VSWLLVADRARMTVDLSQERAEGRFPQGEAAAVSIKRIQDLVAERSPLTRGALRRQAVAEHRLSAPGRDVLSRELTDLVAAEIGKEFGGPTNTTVITRPRRSPA